MRWPWTVVFTSSDIKLTDVNCPAWPLNMHSRILTFHSIQTVYFESVGEMESNTGRFLWKGEISTLYLGKSLTPQSLILDSETLPWVDIDCPEISKDSFWTAKLLPLRFRFPCPQITFHQSFTDVFWSCVGPHTLPAEGRGCVSWTAPHYSSRGRLPHHPWTWPPGSAGTTPASFPATGFPR